MWIGGAPFQKKLMALLLLTSATALLLTCSAFFAYEYVTFRRTTLQHLASVGQIIATNSTAALAFQNQDDAREILAALAAERHIVAAGLYTPDGSLFARYPASAPPTDLPSAPGADGLRFGSGALTGQLPVIQDGSRRLGTLYLRSDLVELHERLRRYLLIAACVIVVSLLVAFVLSSRLQRQIARPILALTAAARAISERGDHSVRVTRHEDDEFGRLIDAFNHMLDRIETQSRALLESETAFRDVAETMPQIVWTATPEGRLDYYNQRWADYAGEGIGQPRLSILHPEDRARCIAQWRRSLDSGGRYEIEYRLRRGSDQSYRWHICRASALRDADGRLKRWIGTCTDIDDLKHAQARLLQTLADLRDRNRDLQDFAFVASHDLQEPLRKIRIYSDRLLSEHGAAMNAEQLRLLDRSHRAAERMQTLIEDVLAYTRIHAKRDAFAPVDLGALIGTVIEDMETRIEALGATIDVQPMPVLSGDATQLRQMFQNLVSNALKFAHPERPPIVRISARPAPLEDGAAGWRIEVSDNGIGIDPQYGESIFTLFKRLHSRDSYEGTGIGLAIVRRIVERHRGSVNAAGCGIDGQGATFVIVLPASPAEAAEDVEAG
jgi:PAS domain S-box-containing protein